MPSPDDRLIVYSRTDVHGYATFTGLAPGLYFLAPDHDGDMVDGTNVEVTPVAETGVTVPIEWPAVAPLPVRSARGTLRLADFYPKQMQPELSLYLVDGISGAEVATTRTDSRGQFSFDSPSLSGIYFIRFREPSDGASGGGIPIDVDRNADEKDLDVDLGWNTCGAHFSIHFKHSEMIVSQLCGDVIDPSGDTLSNAEVWLLSNDSIGAILEQTKTDGKGRFVLPEQADGTYRLIVKRPGFQTFIRTVRLRSFDTADRCRLPIQAQLNIY